MIDSIRPAGRPAETLTNRRAIAYNAVLAREDQWGTVADVSIDPDYCIGSGDCVRVLPYAFELRDELGVSVPLPAAAGADLAILLQVAAACPTQAIRVVGPDGTVLHESNGG